MSMNTFWAPVTLRKAGLRYEMERTGAVTEQQRMWRHEPTWRRRGRLSIEWA